MSARLASPRTVVVAACGVLVLLGGLLGLREDGIGLRTGLVDAFGLDFLHKRL